MPRRFRINGPLLCGLLVFALGFAAYVAFPILVGREFDPAVPHGIGDMIRERGITAVTSVWFFVFGATIGSFLNVVAYRMPMGLTIVSKPSRCPYCETPIQFKHNVPIFGWLALRGRCNACRLPISVRYPLVEVIVGTLFFILFCFELASGGANLPIEFRKTRSGVLWNVLSPHWPLIGLYFFHALLIAILSTIALIKFDRLRIPILLVGFSILVAIGCHAAFPSLCVAPWPGPMESKNAIGESKLLPNLVQPLAGLLVGTLVGWAMHCIVEQGRRSNASRTGIIVICAIVGTFLGWPIVVPFVFATILLQFFTMLSGKLIGKSTDHLWAASCLWAATLVMCLWKQLPILGLPSQQSSPWVHWVWLCVAMVAGFVVVHFSTSDDNEGLVE